MSKRLETFQRIEQRFEKGDRTMLLPLDHLILDQLPDEGTNVGGYYLVGETASALAKKMKPLTSADIATRLRLMNALGLTVKVTMIRTSAAAWQVTKKGKEELSRWKAQEQA